MKTLVLSSLIALIGCNEAVKIRNNGNLNNHLEHPKEDITIKPSPFDNPELVKQLVNKGIEFNFVLGKSSPFGEHTMIEITCFVKNTTDKDVYYLCQSCNGLDYYLEFDSKKYSPYPFMVCNATYPMIAKLTAGESIDFKLQILKEKDAFSLDRVGLDFRVVDRFIEFEKLKDRPELIEPVYRAETKPENIIWKKEE